MLLLAIKPHESLLTHFPSLEKTDLLVDTMKDQLIHLEWFGARAFKWALSVG